jgi:PAS domain S-box-containing protein
MKIKNQFRISIIIFVVIVSVIAASIIVTEQQTAQLNGRATTALDIQTGASTLGYISNNYFLYQDNSSVALWNTEFSALSNDLSQLNSTNPQQQTLVNNVNSDMQNLNSVFANTESFLENAPRNESVRILPAFQLDWSRMAVQNQALAFDAQQLSQSLRDQADQANFTNILLIVAFLGLFGAYFVTNYLITYRNTLKSISKLQAGIAVVGSGNLDYSLESEKKDEIGEIGRSFNQMTTNLKTVTASKADLENEIVERKKTEQALRESEQRWSTTLASIGDAVIATDLSSGLTFMNGVAEKLTGWTLNEASQRPVNSIFNIVNEQTRLGVENPVTRVLKEGTIVGLANHTVLIRKDGTEVPIDDSGAPIRDKDGKVIGVVLVFRDITERKKSERATRRQAALIDLSPDAIMVRALDGTISFWSDGAEKLYGYTKQEALGQVSHSLLDTKFPNPLNEINSQIKSTGQWKGELRHKTKDGKELVVESSWLFEKAEEEEEEEEDGILESNVDITERKKAEDKIKEYQSNLEKLVQERTRQIGEQAELLDKAYEAISVRDLEGHIIYWNKGAERVYGWTAEGALERKITELVRDQAQYDNALHELVSNGEWSGEFMKITKDGKDLIIDSHWTLVSDNSGFKSLIMAIDSDITERKSVEAHLLRTQRLESLGTLAGGIAHDMRNIITPVTIALDLLDKDLTKEENHEMVALLQKNLQRGADLTKQILAFARGTEIERNPVDVPKLIDEIERIIKETFPKSITVEKRVDPNVSVIEGDISQLHQVLMNLCINARDAMPYGGKLCINAENVAIDESYTRKHAEAKPGQCVCIEIADSGVGMSQEVMDRLFEPFFTTKKLGEGTGLGLSTSRSIVKSHGGFINVYSEPGRGSSFKVFLPVEKFGGDQQSQEQDVSLLQGNGQTILLVDDEELIRMTAAMALEKNGYKVIVAGDGAEALSVYVNNKDAIKLVLLDMSMPLMDGAATMKALRKINPKLKIVGMSGLVDSGKYQTTLDMANSFISKPFTTDRLLRTIADEVEK